MDSRSRQNSVTKIDSEQNCRKVAKFIVEATVEVYSPKDWKIRVETTMKFKIETIIEIYSPKDWKFRVETTIKCKVETTEQKLKKEFLVFCFI